MLGINVGRTGSAMIGEAAIAMKSISTVGKTMSGGGSGAADSGGYATSGSEPILQGGLAGVVGRQFHQNAIRNITGKSDSIASNIARSIYNSSVRNGGGFSTNIISQVAKGDIARTGSIKGEDAVQAFQSYMGIDRANHTKETVGTERNPVSAEDTTFDNQSTYSDSSYAEMQTSMEQVLAEYQQNIGMEPFRIGTELPDGSLSPSFVDHQASPSESNGLEKGELFHPSADAAVQYSQIEIGGGRIMGMETAKETGNSVAFAMYSTDKYMPPAQGNYKTVTAVDGSKWYHQYAQPTVVKEPFMKENGEIRYKEHMLIAYAKTLLDAGYNYCEKMVGMAVDIDITCVYMSYVQLSMYGIPAVVIHGDSITVEEWSRWYTPAYVWSGWVFKQPMGITTETSEDDFKLQRFILSLLEEDKEKKLEELLATV